MGKGARTFRARKDLKEAFAVVDKMKMKFHTAQAVSFDRDKKKHVDRIDGVYELDGINAILSGAWGEDIPTKAKFQSNDQHHELVEVNEAPKFWGYELDAPAYWPLAALGLAIWQGSNNALTMGALTAVSALSAVKAKSAKFGGSLYRSRAEEAFDSAKAALINALNGELLSSDDEGKYDNIEAAIRQAQSNTDKGLTWEKCVERGNPASDSFVTCCLPPKNSQDDAEDAWNFHIAILRTVCPKEMEELAKALHKGLRGYDVGLWPDTFISSYEGSEHRVTALDVVRMCEPWGQLLAVAAIKRSESAFPVEGYDDAIIDDGRRSPRGREKETDTPRGSAGGVQVLPSPRPALDDPGKRSTGYEPVRVPQRKAWAGKKLSKFTHQTLATVTTKKNKKSQKWYDVSWDIYLDHELITHHKWTPSKSVFDNMYKKAPEPAGKQKSK